MSETRTRKWCIVFSKRRLSVHKDGNFSEWPPCLVTNELNQIVCDKMFKNRCSTVNELHIWFSLVFKISHSLYISLCSKIFVLLCRSQKNWVEVDLNFLVDMTKKMKGTILVLVMIHGSPIKTYESKYQLVEWHHSGSLSRMEKFRQSLNTWKVITSIFWDPKGHLIIEFMPHGLTITGL